IGLENQPGLNKEETAGKSKCIDGWVFDDLDRKRNFGVGITNEVLPDTIDVFGNHGIIDDLGLTLDLLGHLLAQGNFFFERIEIYFARDVSIADSVGVFFVFITRKSGKRHREQQRQSQTYG